jgi:DNA-binding transcriptional ArsR family regulator
MVSNVILFGYQNLSDSAKLTYQAIDSYDWSDGEGKRKGYAFPSLSTLAELRGVDGRTMRRHIAELEEAGLLRREQRPGQPSLLWIEEPSKEESERYLSTITTGPDTDVRGTPDKNVRPLDEESEESETDKTVNGANAFKGKRGGKRLLSAQERAKREWLADEIVRVCGDRQSRPYYLILASQVPSQLIFEWLSEVRTDFNDRKMRKSRGALFTHKARSYVAELTSVQEA